MIELLQRVAFTFLVLITLLLAVVWVAGLYFGAYGGTLLAQYSDAWRQWWTRYYLLLTLALILLILLLAGAAALGWAPLK